MNHLFGCSNSNSDEIGKPHLFLQWSGESAQIPKGETAVNLDTNVSKISWGDEPECGRDRLSQQPEGTNLGEMRQANSAQIDVHAG
jgi:hypothetical protein